MRRLGRGMLGFCGILRGGGGRGGGVFDVVVHLEREGLGLLLRVLASVVLIPVTTYFWSMLYAYLYNPPMSPMQRSRAASSTLRILLRCLEGLGLWVFVAVPRRRRCLVLRWLG